MTTSHPGELADGLNAVEAARQQGAEALTVLQSAAQAAQLENADLAATAAQLADALVTIRHQSTGEERVVGAAAVPFFTNQGFELLDEPDSQTPGRHEAPEPADAADPGASTTPTDTPSKEN